MNKTRTTAAVARPVAARALRKAPTGIAGLDEITQGGLPRGRTTLVCGDAGCGKTLFAMEFLVRGAMQYGEPGVFIGFEETPAELAENVASLGFDLDRLQARRKIAIDYVHIDPNEILETGEYDLEGLFLRLGLAIDAVKAKRVVLDTIENLFGGFSNAALLRAELRRLFRWLKERGVTAVITGERGDGTLTRQGLEEYVSDCVIVLDHRVDEQRSTRRLRVVKYRGTTHATNEYPFLIDASGLSVLPVTTLGLAHATSTERIGTGVPQLDEMLGGAGYYRGSSILVSGTAGSGKSSLAAHFARETAQRGERCLYLSFEESPAQFTRNMKSVGLDLAPWVKKGLLQIEAIRPTSWGLEMHLLHLHKRVNEFRPRVVVIDPISSLASSADDGAAGLMLLRLVDFLKTRGITALLVHLTSGGATAERTDVNISSLIDTWILLRDIELGGERNRGLYVLKSRGMKHSNQIREFLITSRGIRLEDVYVGPEGVLTGSLRVGQEAREQTAEADRRLALRRRQHELKLRREQLEAQMAALRAEHEAAAAEEAMAVSEVAERTALDTAARGAAAARRGGTARRTG